MEPLTQVRRNMHGPEVATWQRFLQSKGLYSGPINGVFDDQTEAATAEYQKRAGLKMDGLVGYDTVERARRDDFIPPADTPDRDHYSCKSDQGGGMVSLSSDAWNVVRKIAYHYYLWTGEDIIITDGWRSPMDQAERICDKLETHWPDELYRLYNSHQLMVEELEEAYEEAHMGEEWYNYECGLNDEKAILAMAEIIDGTCRRVNTYPTIFWVAPLTSGNGTCRPSSKRPLWRR